MKALSLRLGMWSWEVVACNKEKILHFSYVTVRNTLQINKSVHYKILAITTSIELQNCDFTWFLVCGSLMSVAPREKKKFNCDIVVVITSEI